MNRTNDCSSVISNIDEHHKLPLMICFVILSPCAIVGNSTVIWLYVKFNSLRKPSNRYIVSLALGDLILGCVYAPLLVIQLSFSSDNQSCLINTLAKFLTTLFAISGTTIASIAYDRYIVMSSRYTKTPSRHKAMFLLVTPWFTPLLLFFSKLSGRLINTITVLALMTILYVIVFLSYIKLAYLIKRLSVTKGNPAVTETGNIKEIMAKNKSAIIFVGAIIAATLVFTFPIYVNRCLLLAYVLMKEKWKFYGENEPLILAITHVFFLCSAVFDPYIYVFKHRDFRNAWRKAIGRNNRIEPH